VSDSDLHTAEFDFDQYQESVSAWERSTCLAYEFCREFHIFYPLFGIVIDLAREDWTARKMPFFAHNDFVFSPSFPDKAWFQLDQHERNLLVDDFLQDNVEAGDNAKAPFVVDLSWSARELSQRVKIAKDLYERLRSGEKLYQQALAHFRDKSVEVSQRRPALGKPKQGRSANTDADDLRKLGRFRLRLVIDDGRKAYDHWGYRSDTSACLDEINFRDPRWSELDEWYARRFSQFVESSDFLKLIAKLHSDIDCSG
jgi:hypothetical protein